MRPPRLPTPMPQAIQPHVSNKLIPLSKSTPLRVCIPSKVALLPSHRMSTFFGEKGQLAVRRAIKKENIPCRQVIQPSSPAVSVPLNP